MEAGEEFGIEPTGPSDIRRIEGAIFNWGADMTYENNPIEMGLDRLVDWDSLDDDACISLAALRRIRDAGVERRIVGVEIDGEPFPALNNVKWPVSSSGARVGKVTSAIHSPRLGENIGFAWVPTQTLGARHAARRVVGVGRARRHRRRDAVRRPEEADPTGVADTDHPFSVSTLASGRVSACVCGVIER